MNEERIQRINELYHLSKERPLTEEELNEQGILRAEYLSAVRASIKGQLSQIRIVEEDGTKTALVSVKEKKERYRKECLKIRKNISEERRKEAEEALNTEAARIIGILRAGKVLLYASKDEEVGTDLLFDTLRKRGVSVYYPLTTKDEIVFYEVERKEDLKPGTFGVREPACNEAKRFIADGKKDSVFILVPGLSFNDKGLRIGYGRGYYDRFLKTFEHCSFVKSAGVCFRELKEDAVSKATSLSLPAEKCDQRTDLVLTV